MDVALKLYEKHHPEKSLPTTPNEEELGQAIQLKDIWPNISYN